MRLNMDRNPTKSLTRVCAMFSIAICFLTLLPDHSRAFRIGGQGTVFSGAELRPDERPPFAHWDLREFPNCDVPYALNLDGPNKDVNRDGVINGADAVAAFAAIDAAFTSWTDVAPSLITFIASSYGSPNKRVFLDGQNTVFWLAEGNDDIQEIAFFQGEPNQACITAGPDGVLNSIRSGDDVIAGNVITTGPDGITQSHTLGDDVQVIPLRQGFPNSICVLPGPNGTLETTPQGDDIVAGNDITTGRNGIAESVAGHQVPNFVALTGLFYSNQTGRIIESDIWLNDGPNFMWNIGNENPPDYDIQVTATHEVGHFLGLMHSEVAIATMDNDNWPHDLSKRSLEDDDRAGCNFLYTPDLGDAPDPGAPESIFNRYPSLVHGSIPSRLLNDIQLFQPAEGAEHLFGIPEGDYQYEWLGTNIDDAPEECEAKVIDQDVSDDGVTFLLNRAHTMVVGVRYRVSVRDPLADRYNPDVNGQRMYINAWYDSTNNTGNRNWEHPGERVIHRTVAPGFAPWILFTFSRLFTERVSFPSYSWFRIRLDWGEDGGALADIDSTLNGPRGAAQFGEVEDYRARSDQLIYPGWHHPFDYGNPQLWPWWQPFPGVFGNLLNFWIDVPWWFYSDPFPPPPQSYWFGIAVPPSFIEDGWAVAAAQFKDYAPNGGGDVIANLVPDDAISAELNSTYPMGDETIWFGYKIEDYAIPRDTMVLYFDLSRAEACTNPLAGNFHFVSGDEVNGWNPEFYVNMPIAVCGGVGPVPCAFVPGDINGNGIVNGIDVIYGVSYLKGGNAPPVDCNPPCTGQPDPFYAAMDVNGSCSTNGIDITYFVSYLKGGPALQPCPNCPPAP